MKKAKRVISGVISIISILLLVGIAGAVEMETMSMDKATVTGVVLLAILFIAIFWGGLTHD